MVVRYGRSASPSVFHDAVALFAQPVCGYTPWSMWYSSSAVRTVTISPTRCESRVSASIPCKSTNETTVSETMIMNTTKYSRILLLTASRLVRRIVRGYPFSLSGAHAAVVDGGTHTFLTVRGHRLALSGAAEDNTKDIAARVAFGNTRGHLP